MTVIYPLLVFILPLMRGAVYERKGLKKKKKHHWLLYELVIADWTLQGG